MFNGLELLQECADRLGKPKLLTLEKSEPIAEHRKLMRTLNTILKQIGSFNDWPLLRTEGSIVQVAALETDADSSEFVTATQNSTTVTVAGQSFTETFIGRGFVVSGENEIYRITAVPSTTTLTLDRAWVADSITVADEKIATIAMDRYALPSDFGRPVDDWRAFFGPNSVQPATVNEWKAARRSDQTIRLGDSERYTIYGLTDNEAAQMVHFDPWPRYGRLLRFDYQRTHPQINSDNDNILYPLSYREALIDVILAIHNRDYEDSAKMQKVLEDSIRSHNMQQSNPGLTDSKVRFEPSGDTRISVTASYGVGTDIDWGDAFDTGAIFGL